MQNSHWFDCTCPPCAQNWPIYERLPRDYLKLPGSNFRYKRCNRKELQKDVEKLKAKVKVRVNEGDLEGARELLNQWIKLLDELLVPPHQDFINARRGMKNCLWLQVNAKNYTDRTRTKAISKSLVMYQFDCLLMHINEVESHSS